MSDKWDRLVRKNVQQIVEVAEASAGKDPVCLVVDIDEAGAKNVSVGAMKVIVDTNLKDAVLLVDPEGKRRFVCVPVSREHFFKSVGEVEDVAPLRKEMKYGGTLVLWAACVMGNEWTCVQVHDFTAEVN